MKKIIILLAIVALHSCDIPAKYPITHHTRSGCITYINDSIVVISTNVSGLDNYETKIINLKNNNYGRRTCSIRDSEDADKERI